MTQTFTIPHLLPSLNEYTRACRAHWSHGAKMKREHQDIVAWTIRAARVRPYARPVRVSIRWVEKNIKRDFDNITAFGTKVILDALVQTEILHDDGAKWVTGISHERTVDRASPRVEVTITDK